MATSCPNCNHSVRKGSNFCGFCGANLAYPVQVASAVQSGRQDKSIAYQALPGKKQAKPKKYKTSRVVTTTAIILLFLIIFLSVLFQYWSEISHALVKLFFTAYVQVLT